jgi:hypothetical protein
MNNIESQLPPDPPEFDRELLSNCEKTGNWTPVLFEWYKYTGQSAIYTASIDPESPALRKIDPKYFTILIGLINRCARLMLSNVVLTHEGKFGETASIIDRCISESAIKIRWLCKKNSKDCFMRFMADGLKSEIEFKKKIQENIKSHNGLEMVIEERMLKSIDRYIQTSGLSPEEIVRSKKLPDLANMLNDLEIDRLGYVVIQRMGSHHIHGTWPGLLCHYLEETDKGLSLRDHDCAPSDNQYVLIPLLVINALSDFVAFIFEDTEDINAFTYWLEGIKEEILKINSLISSEDIEYTKH